MLAHGDWPLVGRDGELGVIGSVLSSDAPGLLLVGEPGVGKTRLLRAALGRLAGTGLTCEWVAATGAARSIPFGAVSRLLPRGQRVPRDPAALFAGVAHEFAQRPGAGPVLVAIDDAHWLDEPSAGLLHQLAVHGLARLAATARAGEPVAEALTSLWRGGGRRIEVRPLPESAVDGLLAHALPGPVDPITRRRLHRLAAGNPLLLGEMLADALETGALRRSRGFWRWRGTGSGSPRLAELVSARLRALDPAARQALEVVACGEPLPLALLERLAEPAAIEAAERCGMAVAERSGARVALRLAHPLYGEALRASMPASRSRAIFGQLAQVLAQGPMRRSDDALIAGVWQWQSGVITHPGIVLSAARQAVDRFDIDLAERLARAARNAGHGWEADWLLARVLQYQARSQEAFDTLPPAPEPGGKQLAMWAITRAGLLYWGLDRTQEALDTLARLPSGTPGQDLAVATRSWILFYDGRCGAALEAGMQVLDRPGSGARARAWAAMTAAAAAGVLGRTEQALDIVARGRSGPDGAADRPLWSDAQLGFGLCYALRAAGRLDEAAEVADAHYGAAVASDAGGMAGTWAGFRGVIAKSQGRLADADAALREAIALLEEKDQYHLIRTYAAELAGVRAMAGDVDEAAKWLAEADARERACNRLFHPWVELDRAWVIAASGDLMAAVRTALAAADLARECEQPTLEVVALYDCARLGAPGQVRARLAAVADRLGGIAPALAMAAAAVSEADGPALDRAAETFAATGHLLLAAEAASAAAGAYRRAGQGRMRAAVAARAAELTRRCQGARTPLLGLGPPEAVALTRRERDVAVLAVSLTSREIADRLGLSVNTVNNNLARAFAKLGVRNRRELAATMSPDEPD